MDRAEQQGLAWAFAGHALLLAALSASLMTPHALKQPANPSMAVSLVDATALESAAPDAVREASPPPATVDPLAPETPPPPDVAPTRPAEVTPPRPRPTPAARPAKPPERPQERKPSLDRRLVADLSAEAAREARAAPRTGTGKGTGPTGSGTPAQRTAAQLEASFIQAVFDRMKPFWRAPTGVDSELLKTQVAITLNRDGSLASAVVTAQTGVNESNAAQKQLHAERAIRAVQRAAPFSLPPEHYDIWKRLDVTFDRRLTR